MINFLPKLMLGVAFILLLPLLAMQFTDEVKWNLTDFVVAGILVFGVGLTYKLAEKKEGNTMYRSAVGLALAAVFILIWVNGAVGIIGSENNDANLMYFGVLAIGGIGTIIARFESHGMALAMFATALAQALVPVIALIIWPPQVISWGAAGVFGVFILNAFFVALFIGSALLFRKAARAG